MEVPERIEVESGERIVLSWADGTSTALDAVDLRSSCPCAACREPSGAVAVERLIASGVPIRIADARLVGSYALHLTFEPDGHSTGIYSFDGLRGPSP